MIKLTSKFNLVVNLTMDNLIMISLTMVGWTKINYYINSNYCWSYITIKNNYNYYLLMTWLLFFNIYYFYLFNYSVINYTSIPMVSRLH